jgi:integrase
MTFNLREKHGEYYCVVTYHIPGGGRKERWVPLRISTKENRKKEAKELVEELSRPGAFDPDDIQRTNETMRALGLYPFDGRWRPDRKKEPAQAKPKIGRPKLYDDSKPAEKDETADSLARGRDVLFGDYLEFWINAHREEVSETTYAGESTSIRHKIIPWFNAKGVTLKKLKPQDIEQFLSDQKNTGVSSNTLRHYYSYIRSALQYGFRKSYIDLNVADRVDKPKKGDFHGSFYNDEELKKLLSLVKGSHLEFAVRMAAIYGLRREEIVGIKWDAIDFQYRTITIAHTVSEVMLDGKYTVLLKDTTKNKSSFRTLPISDETMDMLLSMKEKQEKMKALFGNRYNHKYDDYVYVFENGDLIRPNWVTYQFKKTLSENGLRHIRFHDLRHSCATLLRHEGVPMEEIQKWLGHSIIVTTEQIYAHYDEGGKSKTLETITGALSPKREDKALE